MSEKKSKLKKILIPIIIVVVIAIAICLFFVFKSKNNKKNNNNTAENVSSSSNIETQINIDVINQKVCVEYNGNYIYDSIINVEFDGEFSNEEKNKIYKSIAKNNIHVKDANTFGNYISNIKKYENSNEIITLVDGKYTKSNGSAKVELGLYYGNLNKSIIYNKDDKGTTVINEINYTPSFEISQTGYWLQNNTSTNNGKSIYIREKVYYGNTGEKFVYISYKYKMIDYKAE